MAPIIVSLVGRTTRGSKPLSLKKGLISDIIKIYENAAKVGVLRGLVKAELQVNNEYFPKSAINGLDIAISQDTSELQLPSSYLLAALLGA